MARSGKTAQEFIQSSFSPIIAVLCSPKVGNITLKNNLTLPELLQPFGNMDWEGQIREPGGSVCIIKNMKLIIRDIHWKPLPPTEARKQLNNAVLHNYNDKTVLLELDGRKLDVPQATPWFDAWRETYLEVQFPSDHEYTNHFLSTIIVGTTLDENIVDTFNALNQQYAQLQNVAPPKLPKWFNQGVLKSYLLLHDVSAVPKEKAEAAFETLKQAFGPSNCFMLSINSKSTTDPTLPTDYWIQYIKRSSDASSEMLASVANLAVTPPDSQPFLPVAGSPAEEGTTFATNLPEGMHPLTTENDIYDNANSLQCHSFSGSSESMNVNTKPMDYSTEVHGLALNAADVDSIRKFLQEYTSKAFLPYLEKQISQLSELVANRKGVSRSLFSATKRWFGTGKGGNTTSNNTVIYSAECPELQLRRLGDLWFLCGQWPRAFDAYHTAKREFYADSAWLCYAGALEMAAVSAFMAGEASKKTHAYMEESIVTYLNTCRMVQYAVRASLLSVVCLGASGLHGEAAKQLIRMTSEDSDLRSAMLLEQAALCFLSGPGSKAMCRKYAFHMVLAGHRFSKAGQKKHAYRCYNQAYQVYAESGWRLSTDHVQFALGRLAGALRLTSDAVRWLGAPLAPAARALQPAHQQDAFLREYMLAHQQWVESSDEFKEHLPILPLPLLESEATAVLCVGPAPLSSPGRSPATSIIFKDDQEPRVWHKLEEMLLQVAQGGVPMIFKPTVDLYTAKTDRKPVVPQGEPIQISITLRNPLKVVIILKDVELLWKFVSDSDDLEGAKQVVNNEPMIASGSSLESNAICGQKIKSVLLEGESSKTLIFNLTPLQIGELSVQGIAYKLINAGEGGNENTNGSTILGKLDLISGINASDKRLQITVIPQAPCLQMTFTESSPSVISGELRTVDVELRNVGPVDMGPVLLATARPDCVLVGAARPFRGLYEEKYRPPAHYPDERAARTAAWRELAARHVALAADGVARGATARVRLVLRAHAAAPALALLAYYEPAAPAPAPAPRRHRLLRHVFRFEPTEAVEISVTPRRSLKTASEEVYENMNLVTEIKNICSEKDNDISLEIVEASLLSRQWRLSGLHAAAGRAGRLRCREKLHLVFQARRVTQPVPEGEIECSGLKVATGKPDSEDNINVSPYSDFVTDYESTIDNIVDPISRNTDKSDGLVQSMFIVRWKAHDKTKGTTAIGQHFLWLDDFSRVLSLEREVSVDAVALQLEELDKADSREATNKNKHDVVVFRMEHTSLVSHDFHKSKLCLVPVTINIVNCYGIPVKVFIDLSKQPSREGVSELGWAGALSDGGGGGELGLTLQLARFEARRVRLRAACAAPGAYLVGSAFAVSSAGLDDRALTLAHAPNNTSLLVVQHA